MSVYVGSLVATKAGAAIEVEVFVFLAKSRAEAIGGAVERARDKWPGYSIQVGPFDPIEDRIILLAAQALAPSSGSPTARV